MEPGAARRPTAARYLLGYAVWAGLLVAAFYTFWLLFQTLSLLLARLTGTQSGETMRFMATLSVYLGVLVLGIASLVFATASHAYLRAGVERWRLTGHAVRLVALLGGVSLVAFAVQALAVHR